MNIRISHGLQRPKRALRRSWALLTLFSLLATPLSPVLAAEGESASTASEVAATVSGTVPEETTPVPEAVPTPETATAPDPATALAPTLEDLGTPAGNVTGQPTAPNMESAQDVAPAATAPVTETALQDTASTLSAGDAATLPSEIVLVPGREADAAAATVTPAAPAQTEENTMTDAATAEEDAYKDFAGVVRQSGPLTCGPAALATLRTQLGTDTSEKDVLALLTIDPEKGTSLLALKNAAQKLGDPVVLKKWTADQVLAYVQDTNDPVLIHDEKEGVGGHFSVLRTYDHDKDTVTLSDTEAGNITYAATDFARIYTGAALIITDNPTHQLLADPATTLADEDAAAIWGKYVPVSILAANSGDADARRAAAAFESCIQNAMHITNAATRTDARSVCYAALARALGEGLNYAQETALATAYAAGTVLTTVDDTAIGTKDYLAALDELQRLSDKRASLADEAATYRADTQRRYELLVEREKNRRLLPGAQGARDHLRKAVEKQEFEKNGQKLSLGAVGKDLNATTARYEKLSARLDRTLASLDGRIRAAYGKIDSLNRDIREYRDDERYHEDKADYYKDRRYEKHTVKIWGKKYTVTVPHPSAIAKYEYHTWRKNAARDNIHDAEDDIRAKQRTIADLERQKRDERNAVDEAAAQRARLERLAEFGRQEMRRKRAMLALLERKVDALQDDIADADRDIATLNKRIQAHDPTRLYDLDRRIADIRSRWGIAPTADLTDLRTKEFAFVRQQDNATALAATMQSRTANSIAISLFPGIGEGYDIATLISGTDPLTKEKLGPLPKVLTFAGLISGYGSGAAARKAGDAALMKLAEETEVDIDEITTIATDLAKERYAVSSLDDLKKIRSADFSLENFVQEVRERVGKTATKIFSISLDAQDGVAGAHVLERHVGKSREFLMERFAKKEVSDIATTFHNQDIAEKAINTVLNDNADKVRKWLESAKVGTKDDGDTVRNVDVGIDLGFGFEKNSDGSLREINNLQKLTLVLKRTDETSEGFVVLTTLLNK